MWLLVGCIFSLSVTTARQLPAQSPSTAMLASAETRIQPRVASFTVWRLPGDTQTAGRWKRKETKLRAKGKQGSKLGRRKTEAKKMISSGKIQQSVKLSNKIPTQPTSVNKFGNKEFLMNKTKPKISSVLNSEHQENKKISKEKSNLSNVNDPSNINVKKQERKSRSKLRTKGKQGSKLGRRKNGAKQMKSLGEHQQSGKLSNKNPTSHNNFGKKEIKSKSNSVLNNEQQENKINSKEKSDLSDINDLSDGNLKKDESKSRERSSKERRRIRTSVLPRRGKHTKPLNSQGRHTARVGTVKNYRTKNEDGSITWGYQNDDGSYKEETIGIDCVTRGRYGYTDPRGRAREYSYSMGSKCDKESLTDNGITGARGPHGGGYYDYQEDKFVMQDGRRVNIRVNQNHRARG